jgi:large subunit ribosomal protein L16
MQLESPKKTKFKKFHKGKSFKKMINIKSIKNFKFKRIKLISSTAGRISANEIKSIKAIIRKGTKKKAKVKYTIFPNMGITKKPKGIRMGKGKGNLSSWVFNAKGGRILLSIKTRSKKKIKKLLSKVRKRISVKVKII